MTILPFFLLFLNSLWEKPENIAGLGAYELSSPVATYSLPPVLNEISGIEMAGDQLACVQDETGMVFMYDLLTAKISEIIPFGPAGDYEGVACGGNSLFVLRSDGLLYEISNYADSARREVKSYYTAVRAKNNEGLCFDVQRNALLIAAKTKSRKGKYGKSHRDIYIFDLARGAAASRPLVSLNISEAKQFILDQGIDLPVKYRKKGRRREDVLKFHTSAIAKHPETGEIYLISSTDRFLMVYSPNGQLNAVFPLSPLLFGKPEGIAFKRDGTLLLSNEGEQGVATIHAFNRR